MSDISFALLLAFFHVAFTVAAWVSGRYFVGYMLYRAGDLTWRDKEGDVYNYDDIMGRTILRVSMHSFVLLSAIAWHLFFLGRIGAGLAEPLNIGLAPNIGYWPNPVWLLGASVVIGLLGAAYMMKDCPNFKTGSRVMLAGTLPLLVLFFYAIPLK